MFVFKIWGNFASFRDPLTISQNLSLPLPPKTTVGGMMASILGIESFFDDESYFDFDYSCIALKDIRKKSFSQNYIENYTSKVGTKISAYETAIKKYQDVEQAHESLLVLKEEKRNLLEQNNLKKTQITKLEKLPTRIYKQLKVINKKCQVLSSEIEKLNNKLNETFIKPKPTNRELILNPSYLIIINNFKYEDEITTLLKMHASVFPFYLGNSEFGGNFKYIESKIVAQTVDKIDSFSTHIDNIEFSFEQKYSNMTMPLKTVQNRQYKEFKKIVFSDKAIKLKEPIDGVCIELRLDNQLMEFGCEFI